MVLLTMTAPVVAGLVKTQGERKNQSTDDANEAADTTEPSLDDPAVGKPISHGQIIDLWQALKKECQADAGMPQPTLEALLVGAKVYVPPPPPKPEPSDEYKALMARLRRDEEARAYERMINPPDTHVANTAFAQVHRPVRPADMGEDEVTLNDVHRQVMLILNFVLTMGGVAYALWVLARWWPTPSRLFLSMGGCLLTGIAEYGLYAGYVWHLSEAKTKEAKIKKNEEVKEVVRTWVVNPKDDEKESKEVMAKQAEPSPGLSSGAGKSATDESGIRRRKKDPPVS